MEVVATQVFLECSPWKLGKMNPFWLIFFQNGSWNIWNLQPSSRSSANRPSQTILSHRNEPRRRCKHWNMVWSHQVLLTSRVSQQTTTTTFGPVAGWDLGGSSPKNLPCSACFLSGWYQMVSVWKNVANTSWYFYDWMIVQYFFWIAKFIQWFSQVGVDERMLDMWLSMRKIYVRMFLKGMYSLEV